MFEHPRAAPQAIARARRLRASMTRSEQRLWRELKTLDAHMRRQAPIGPFVVDFACQGKKLVIEVDGGVHERLDEVILRDHERSEWLRGQGYQVVRFANRQVDDDLFAVVEAIKSLQALPLDGEGLGWGVPAEPAGSSGMAPTPTGAKSDDASRPPQSPTLSPSRGRGE